MKVTLYPHQLASIYKMEQLEIYNKIEKENCVKYTKIGINSDPTGYGKTLSMIGLILRDKM
jgi:CRISPR/Cas system-associated endonuclease/helicase Cas3